MKRNFIWPAVFVLLVLGTVFGLPFLFARLNGGPFPWDTLISLIVAVLTLEATVLIAFYIHALQNNALRKEASRQEDSAKQMLFKEIDAGLEATVRMPKAGATGDISSHLSEILVSFLPSIQYSLSADQLHHLIKLVDVLSNTAKLAASDGGADAAQYIQGCLGLFVQEQFIPAMQSPFANCFALIDDHHKVLAPITRSTLECLSGQEFPPPATDRLVYLKAQPPLLELHPDGRCRITDIDGQLLCDAVFDDTYLSGIAFGWAKLDDYEGEYQAGKRHGRGVSYSLLGHHRIFDGLWENNEPKQGTQFHTVLQKTGQKGGANQYKDLFPYWDEGHLLPIHVTDYLINRADFDSYQAMEDLYVGDVTITGDSFSFEEDGLCPLEAFMAEHDPKSLAQYREFCDSVWEEDPCRSGENEDPDESA